MYRSLLYRTGNLLHVHGNQGLATFNGIRYLWYDPTAENPTVMTSYELEKTPEFLE